MARYKKIPMKIDTFETRREEWFERAYNWVARRWKPIAVVAAVIVFFVVFSLVLIEHQRRQDLESRLDYLEIMKVGDENARAVKLETFAKDHDGNEVSRLAYMWLGSYYKDNGNLEGAISSYEAVVKGSRGEPIYFVALDAVAPIYIDSGKPLDEVAGLYLEASEMGGCPDRYASKIEAANIYGMAKDFEKAQDIYKSIIGDEKASPQIQLKAEEKLLWLSAQRDQ